MEHNKELTAILDLIDRRQLRKALDALESFAYKYPEMSITPRLGDLREDYNLMADYWQRGYRDDQRSEVYDRLLRQAYSLTTDVAHEYAVAHQPFLSYASRRVRPAAGQYDTMLDTLKDRLEGFVTDGAMLQLETAQIRQSRQADLYDKHQQLLAQMFDYVWTSGQWKDNEADTLEQIALSPTVDAIDQQVLVTAVTLSAMACFDIRKLRMLVQVYLQSPDEHVRQRALVGWVLALGQDKARLFPDEQKWVDATLADDRTVGELTELQIQLIYCMNAEQDNQTIQKDIMPTIMKHNNLHITPHGIEEKEDDPMQDILDPEATERGMEKLEASFHKMIDMQKAGSDIYFTGFSQMKRFPFFDSICNWFVPFYPEHPGISALVNRDDMGAFMNDMLARVPFCNSDKYSFVLAFQQVADRIPANMREMLKQGAPVGAGVFSDSDMQTGAYIRRIYLQDLYRFFRIYPSRSCFRTPFSREEGMLYLFFANSVFAGSPLEEHFGEITAALMKRNMNREAEALLRNYSDNGHNYQYYMLCGNMILRHRMKSHLSASDCFAQALALRPGDRKALTGEARAFFYEERYTDAADAYSRLIESQPDNRGHILAYSVCLTNLAAYDKALPLLYKLNYEQPDDPAANRVMARALTGSGKYDQALKLYEALLDGDRKEDDDLVNCGYCEWFMGRVPEAISHFSAYLDKLYPQARPEEILTHCQEDIIDSERDFILAHGITETEMQLMGDAVFDKALR